jgi:hypothetical protein
MTVAEVSAQGKACDFVREFADDPHCLRLLRFFGAHPYTRFSRLAILHAKSIDGCKSCLEKALRRLVSQGIVKECVENGFPLYSLIDSKKIEVEGRDVHYFTAGQGDPLVVIHGGGRDART